MCINIPEQITGEPCLFVVIDVDLFSIGTSPRVLKFNYVFNLDVGQDTHTLSEKPERSTLIVYVMR